MSVLSSILGMVVLIAIAVLLSNNRKAISIRTVLGALAIQVGFAALFYMCQQVNKHLVQLLMPYQMLLLTVTKVLTLYLVV